MRERDEDVRGEEPAPEPETGTRLSAEEIHENLRKPAEEELERPTISLLFSALAAGLTIGFSFLGAAFAFSVAPPAYAAAAAAAAFPLGFIFVVLGRNELFTENTLEPIIPLLEERTRIRLMETLRLWAILLVGNLIGAWLFALALAETGVVEARLAGPLTEAARHGMEYDFGLVLYRSIFGGWLLAMMTWLLASTRSTLAQIIIVWLITAPIEAFGFYHSIAGSVETFYLAEIGARGWLETLLDFTLPALIGNTVGGVVLVALLNYGQVAPQVELLRRHARHEKLRRLHRERHGEDPSE